MCSKMRAVALFIVIVVASLASCAVVRTHPRRTCRQAPVTEPTTDCVCVLLQQCNANFTLNKHGETIIDIRFKGPCPHYLEVCCKTDKADNATSPPPPVSTNLPTPSPTGEPAEPQPTPKPTTLDRYQSRGCGFRNVDGVGFRIIGRKNEAQFGEFPWVVALLGEDDKYICGGSLIHPKVVLTSTHCVRNKFPEKLIARAGEWDRGTTKEVLPHQDRKIAEIIEHENYHGGALLNDISLLILKEPMKLTDNVDVICLPSQDYNFDLSQCVASGWGKREFNASQNNIMILKKVDLPVVPRHECEQALQKTRLGPFFELHDSFICAGGKKGQDTCDGDGGSPLMCPLKNDPQRYEQAGIVAWGVGCGDVLPGIYANVARFIDWINKHLGDKGITISNT